MDSDDVIESVMCPDKFITIGGASNGGTRRVTLPAQFASGLPSAPFSDNNTHPEDRNYTQADNYTSTLEWDDKIPPTVVNKDQENNTGTAKDMFPKRQVNYPWQKECNNSVPPSMRNNNLRWKSKWSFEMYDEISKYVVFFHLGYSSL